MTPETADSPATIYRDSLSPGSAWPVEHALETIVSLLGGRDPWSYPRHRLRYRDTARVRSELVAGYAPATVNKIPSVLRGVLKTCWRLGLIDAETLARTADVPNVRAQALPAGRAASAEEVRALLSACTADPSPAGRSDAAILAVLWGGGLRRAEVCGLDLSDFDGRAGTLMVRATKGRQDRRVYLTTAACRLLSAWTRERGSAGGPLFVPVTARGGIRSRRLGGESIRYLLGKRQRQAGIEALSPHSLRRGFITSLLDAGVDVLTVQRMAGHADAVTTARYDRRGEVVRRRVARQVQLPIAG